MPKYVYSFNNEDYLSVEDFEDQLLEMCQDSETPKNGDMEIYKAEKVTYMHSSFINANSILETISQNAYDEADDYAESYCNKLDYMQDIKVKELKELINNFLDSAIGKPNFFTVKNVVKIKYKDIDENT